MSKKKVIVVGAGLGGLSAACYLAKNNFDVTVIEKNNSYGGRASIIEDNGFRFDMGPSWYWMPEIYDRFFADFNKKTSDYFELLRIDPSYRVFWDKNDVVDMPTDLEKLYEIFESIETGSSKRLKKIMQEGEEMLNTALSKFLYREYKSILDLANPELIVKGLKLKVYKSLSSVINSNFKNKKLRQLCTWQSLFLGATPENLPSLYSFMIYVDFKLGTWYPKGGIFELPKAIFNLAQELGVNFKFNSPVTKIEVSNGIASGVYCENTFYSADSVVFNGDYHFAETKLLSSEWQSYSENYWSNTQVAPSCLLYYVGLNKKLKNVLHHNYYFSENWDEHFKTLFKNPDLPPKDPAFYFNVTSVTDKSVAPSEKECMFILIPVASNLSEIDSKREEYFKNVVKKIEELTGNNITNSIEYYKAISQKDQIEIYNSYKGTCFGLAQTLFQTASFRPKNRSKKVKNLFYCGHFAHPGIGMPMVIISGQVAANLVKENVNNANTN
jgi:phytoene desaturase